MKELLEYIAKNVTKHPEDVKVEEVADGTNITLNLTLNDEDKPLIIGKLGRNIKAIRDTVALIAVREGKRVYIKVLD